MITIHTLLREAYEHEFFGKALVRKKLVGFSTTIFMYQMHYFHNLFILSSYPPPINPIITPFGDRTRMLTKLSGSSSLSPYQCISAVLIRPACFQANTASAPQNIMPQKAKRIVWPIIVYDAGLLWISLGLGECI